MKDNLLINDNTQINALFATQKRSKEVKRIDVCVRE